MDEVRSNVGGGRVGIAIVALALVTVGWAAPLGSATAADAPVLAEDSTDEPASWGIRVDRDTVGDIRINLDGVAPAQKSEVSVGAVIFEDRELRFALALSVHASPDRTITTPFPSEAEDERRQAVQMGELPDSVELDLGLPSGDEECPLICLTLDSFDQAAKSHYYIVWVAGTDGAELSVKSEDGGNAVTKQGDSLGLGDPALQNGVSYQVQRTFATPLGPQPLGFKVMKDARADFAVDEELWGAWGVSDFKKACSFGPGPSPCLNVANNRVCQVRDMNCYPSKISYDGPDGGETGESVYGLWGESPGDYTFRVDHKVDPYGPEHYDETSGTWVDMGENYSWLSVADVSLPDPPAS
jgi:hypothetical protein